MLDNCLAENCFVIDSPDKTYGLTARREGKAEAYREILNLEADDE